MSGRQRQPISLAERAARAAKLMKRQEQRDVAQNQQQVALKFAEVTITFRSEWFDDLGKSRTFVQAACVSDGPWVRVIQSDLAFAYPFESIASIEMIPSVLREA